MIALIIKSYFTIFLSVGIGCIIFFAVGLIFIFKKLIRHNSSLSIKNSAEETQFIYERNAVSRTLHPKTEIEDNIKRENLATTPVINDISAIAGDNVISTQLDLARAYLETDKKSLAKKILQDVILQGDHLQKKEAEHLLSTI